MSKHYKMLDRRDWTKVAEQRKAYKEKKISHAQYVFMRDIVLENGYYTNANGVFSPYFLAQMAGKTRAEVADILNRAKMTYENQLSERIGFEENPDYFGASPINWVDYRPYDEDFNSYDTRTEKCVMPWKFSAQDEDEFYETHHIDFVDPYCDGRDCTGAPFTTYMKFLRCADRTVIIHRIGYDL